MRHGKIFLPFFLILIMLLAGCDTSHKGKAKSYLEARRYDEAIEMYRKAILDDPDDPEAHCGLGKAYIKKIEGRYLKGVFSSDPVGGMKKAEKETEQSGIYDKAMVEFEKTLESDPYNFDALFYLGSIYFKKGMNENAVEVLEEAIRLDPKHAEAHLYLGMSLGLVQNTGFFYNPRDLEPKYDDIVRGIKEVNRAVILNPQLRNHPTVRMSLSKMEEYIQEINNWRKSGY